MLRLSDLHALAGAPRLGLVPNEGRRAELARELVLPRGRRRFDPFAASLRESLAQAAFNRRRVAQLTMLHDLLATGATDDEILDRLRGCALPWRAAA